MEAWSNFAVGELGAAAAFAGLLFVSISVNLDRILQLGRMAERGLEALAILFLVIVVTSLILVPGQPLRLLGGEIAATGVFAVTAIVMLQSVYLSAIEPMYRRHTKRVAWFNRSAVSLMALAGITLVWRNDTAGFYVLALSILLCFLSVGLNAWVLLIEIKR